MPSLYFTQVNV